MSILDSLSSVFDNSNEVISEEKLRLIKHTAIDALKDSLESIVSGKRTIEEWAELVEPIVEDVIDQSCKKSEMTFAGGRLKFFFDEDKMKKVNISYELYFVNQKNEWNKIEATSSVFADMFTEQCLNDLRESKEIAYEVT